MRTFSAPRFSNVSRLAQVCAAYAIAGGLVASLGWIFKLEPLTDWLGTDIVILPNTSLGMLLSGLGLWVISARVDWRGPVVRGIAAALSLLGGITVLQHLTGINTGLDTFLISPQWGHKAATAPGRMGPPAAASLLMLGIGLWAGTTARMRKILPAMGLAVVFISGLGVMGYLFRANPLFSIARITGIAFPTATMLFALGIGLLATAEDLNPAKLLGERSEAGRLARRALLFSIGLPFLLGQLFIYGRERSVFDRGMGTALLIFSLISCLILVVWWCVSDLAKAESASRVSEQRFRLATFSKFITLYEQDDRLRYTWLYPLRKENEHSLGRSDRELLPAQEAENISRLKEEVMRTGESRQTEMRATLPDGPRVYQLLISAHRNGNGRIVGVAGAALDVTERHQAQEAVQESIERLRATFSQAPVGIVIVGGDRVIIETNDKFSRIVGYPKEELCGLDVIKLTYEGDLETTHQHLQKLLSGETNQYTYEKRFVRKDGSLVWIRATVSVTRSVEGKVQRFIGAVEDIDDRKRAEETAQARTKSLEIINRVGGTLAAELDLEKLVQSVTDAGREISGAQFGAFFYNIKNEKGESYMLYTISGVPREEFSKFPMPRNTAVFRPTFEGQGIIRLDDVLKDPRYGQNAPYYGMPKGHLPVRSYLAVPVISRTGEVLGGLFYGHSTPGVFSETAEIVLEAIASQAAVAIDNAQLYRDLQRELAGHKVAEAALRDSEERFRAVINNSTAVIYVKTCEGTYLMINQQYAKLFNTSEEEFVGKTDFDLFPPEVARQFRENDLAVVQSGIPREIEEVVPQADGPHTYLSIKFPLKASDGQIYALAGISTDITDRKKSQEATARLAAIVESSDDAIVTKNLDGIVTSWNRGAERIFGYKAEEIIGKSITILIPENRQDEEPGILAKLRAGQSIQHYETIRRRKDGVLLNISLTVSPLCNEKGEIIGASKIARDVTELRRAHEALERSHEELEKRVAERTRSLTEAVEQMEEFSYSVSHDLRAPVRAMQGYAQAILEDYGHTLDDQGKDYLDRIVRSGHRMDRLVRDILTYSRIARAQISLLPVDLDVLVADIISQYTEMQPPHSQISIRSPLGKVNAHEPSLGQAISNLLRNAVKFVAPGVLPSVKVYSEIKGPSLRLWVEDNGIGIPPEYHGKLFGLFERIHTEHPYEGTGIGLAVVRKSVERMGGRVGVESKGQGSRFWIELPAADTSF